MIIAKTELGHQVMKDRSVALTPRQRAALILIDGKRTVQQLLAATGSGGVTRDDLDILVTLGLAGDLEPPRQAEQKKTVAEPVVAEAVQHRQRPPQERYAAAYPIATRLTASLGLRGFRLNLAVEAATSYEDLALLAPKILAAVGPEKFAPLHNALNDQ